MTQFDAAATPMYESFTAKPDLTPYKHLPANVDINAVNVAGAFGAAESAKMDFSKEDAADDLLLNEITGVVSAAHIVRCLRQCVPALCVSCQKRR